MILDTKKYGHIFKGLSKMNTDVKVNITSDTLTLCYNDPATVYQVQVNIPLENNDSEQELLVPLNVFAAKIGLFKERVELKVVDNKLVLFDSRKRSSVILLADAENVKPFNVKLEKEFVLHADDVKLIKEIVSTDSSAYVMFESKNDEFLCSTQNNTGSSIILNPVSYKLHVKLQSKAFIECLALFNGDVRVETDTDKPIKMMNDNVTVYIAPLVEH